MSSSFWDESSESIFESGFHLTKHEDGTVVRVMSSCVSSASFWRHTAASGTFLCGIKISSHITKLRYQELQGLRRGWRNRQVLYNFDQSVTHLWLWRTWRNFYFVTLPGGLWQGPNFVRWHSQCDSFGFVLSQIHGGGTPLEPNWAFLADKEWISAKFTKIYPIQN